MRRYDCLNCIGVAFATHTPRIKHVAVGRGHGRDARLGSSIREHTYSSKVAPWPAMCNGNSNDKSSITDYLIHIVFDEINRHSSKAPSDLVSAILLIVLELIILNFFLFK